MKHFYVISFCCLILSFSNNLFAEKETNENSTTIILSLVQDPSFGFYPSVNGSIPLNNKTDLTFYGIFWTQDALAGKQGGIGLLTEFGLGVNFKLANGSFFVNPNIGLGNGKFQSGGSRHIIGDNLVFSLFTGYYFDNLEFALNGIYWKGFRKEEMISPYIDQIEYNFSSWYKTNNWFLIGLYIDHFLIIEDDKQTKDTYTGYFWIGPAFKFTAKSGASMWFTFGPDLVQYINSKNNPTVQDYYKLVASFPF